MKTNIVNTLYVQGETKVAFFIKVTLMPSSGAPARPLDKGPFDADVLPEQVRLVKLLFGRQRLFVRLELDEGVTFEKTGSTIQVQVEVLDVAVLGELVVNVVLLRLLVNPGDEEDPAFDRTLRIRHVRRGGRRRVQAVENVVVSGASRVVESSSFAAFGAFLQVGHVLLADGVLVHALQLIGVLQFQDVRQC